MNIIVTEDYTELSRKALEIILNTVKSKPDCVLGLATGTTPLGLYERMCEDHLKNGTSYKNVRAVNLDEYVGVSADNPNSYAYFMRKNLFDKIDIDIKNTHIENGTAPDPAKECERYEEVLSYLQQDIQLLGLGSNGHIAFNEPNTPFSSGVHVVELAKSTIDDNSRLFAKREDVPVSAYTMGLKNIMNAKRILILASGENKAEAVYKMVLGEVTSALPASILQTHPDCTLIADKSAAKFL